MAGRHRFTGRSLLPTPRLRRATEWVDARSGQAHLLTDEAVAAGQCAQGSYVALCGRSVLPASLTVGPQRHCVVCRWWRVARA